jgi:hypothetical protein
VPDITKIVLMVAMRLLKKGLHPMGLWRSLHPARAFSPIDNEGVNG